MRNRAKIKMKDFISRYHHCEPAQLPRQKKLPFVYLLGNVYGFSPREIADFFQCHPVTAYRMLSDAVFFHSRRRQQQEEEKRIADYILYIAQWRDWKSIS